MFHRRRTIGGTTLIKACVTGAGGFVASFMVDFLLEKGETVIGTYRWFEDLERAEHFKDKITMVPVDLIDAMSCLKCIREHKPDYIYHLAAQSFVPDSFVYPAMTIMTNTVGTLNLLEAVRLARDEDKSYNPIIVVVSSSEVYGQVEEGETPITESQPFRPQNPYGASKVGADMIAYVYYRCYGMKILRTRLFTHTGPRRTMDSFETSFARQIAMIEAELQEPVVKVGNLESIRTIADVRDAVKAYYILMRKCQLGEVYNIGGDRTMKVGEVLDYLISLSPMRDKIKVTVSPELLRPSDVTLQIPSSEKFKQLTGWEPEIPFEETMKDLLEFWRDKVGRAK